MRRAERPTAPTTTVTRSAPPVDVRSTEQQIAGLDPTPIVESSIPRVTYCEPEVASVGMTADAAHEAGRQTETVDVDLSSVAGAGLHADGYRGRSRTVIDVEREVILGMTFVGPDVAEMLQAATIAVVGEVPISRLWHAVAAYPTMSEIWLRLLEEYGRESA